MFVRNRSSSTPFRSVLLITRCIRLALNVASTRLILSTASEGTAAAGTSSRPSAQFIMSGNYVIGLIMFVILLT